jgi:hypothetical protein
MTMVKEMSLLKCSNKQVLMPPSKWRIFFQFSIFLCEIELFHIKYLCDSCKIRAYHKRVG